MPLDAICLTGVIRELRETVTGLRVEKIQQPTRDQVVLTFRGNQRLLLCAGANQARIHLTAINRENPAAPPMFCMLLRKHIGGGRLTAIEQPPLERAVLLRFAVTDEMGEPGERTLVLECMGRYANLILLDGQGRIMDCLRRVGMEMSEKRQVLPGLFYHLPPTPAKADPLQATEEVFTTLWERDRGGVADRFLLDTFLGMSPLVCREITSRAATEGGVPGAFFAWQHSVLANRFTPYLLRRDGKPWDFSYLPVTQYGSAVQVEKWDSFSRMLDTFYETREQLERVRQKGHDLQRCAATARDRLCRKLAAQEREYAQTQQRDQLRHQGELITANLYRMERGQSVLVCPDYTQEGCPEVRVPLDPLLSPQENATRYFKRYNKAKTAETALSQQMDLARQERDWLESVLDELTRAESEQDFNDIRVELQAAGYGKPIGRSKKAPRPTPSRPRAFRSGGGFRILVGRSNSQNDALTKNAGKSDYWFHTQRIHGSHVILCTEGRKPDPQSMAEAAALAAWFSQGRESRQVAVDYTLVRNVRKPAAARPGMVIYTSYQTAYVHPDPNLAKRLAEDEKGRGT